MHLFTFNRRKMSINGSQYRVRRVVHLEHPISVTVSVIVLANNYTREITGVAPHLDPTCNVTRCIHVQ